MIGVSYSLETVTAKSAISTGDGESTAPKSTGYENPTTIQLYTDSSLHLTRYINFTSTGNSAENATDSIESTVTADAHAPDVYGTTDTELSSSEPFTVSQPSEVTPTSSSPE